MSSTARPALERGRASCLDRVRYTLSMSESEALPEVAFYYPGHVDSDWLKNLVLFFDGVALLVPDYKNPEIRTMDPSIVTGLEEEGLLHRLSPETLVDKQATKLLVDSMTQIIKSGALNELSADPSAFGELSMSRMGFYGDSKLAERLLRELKKRKLARDSEDSVSIPMDPRVRYLILVLLAQILRRKGSELGMELSPATDRPILVNALEELLNLPQAPSRGNVVSFDLSVVGADLSSIPIDEILAYRRQNAEAYRLYAKSVRGFTRELSGVPAEERPPLFDERQEELNDLASGLRARSRQAWKKPAAVGLTAAGAFWALSTGDVLSLGLIAGGAIVGNPQSSQEAGAYSYLLQIPGRRGF